MEGSVNQRKILRSWKGIMLSCSRLLKSWRNSSIMLIWTVLSIRLTLNCNRSRRIYWQRREKRSKWPSSKL